MVALILLAIAFISCLLCHFVARRKNRSTRTWLVLGILFGPLAVLALLLMPPISST